MSAHELRGTQAPPSCGAVPALVPRTPPVVVYVGGWKVTIEQESTSHGKRETIHT